MWMVIDLGMDWTPARPFGQKPCMWLLGLLIAWWLGSKKSIQENQALPCNVPLEVLQCHFQCSDELTQTQGEGKGLKLSMRGVTL